LSSWVRVKARTYANGKGGPNTVDRSSHELRPVVIRHEWRSGPLLAVHVYNVAGEEPIVGVLDYGDPGGGFWVLEPLVVDMVCPGTAEKILEGPVVWWKFVFLQDVIGDNARFS